MEKVFFLVLIISVYSKFEFNDSLKNFISNSNLTEFASLLSQGNINGYIDNEEYNNFLESLKKEYKDLVSVEEIGKTFNEKPIISIKFGKNIETPSVLFTGMHHPREPVSLHMSIYIIAKLLYLEKENPSIFYQLIRSRNIVFVPLINVDGFIANNNIFRTKTRYGKLRKNQRKSKEFENCGESDIGVDLNRNYDHSFGTDDEGSSRNPCSEDYRGPSAFSENETIAIKNLVEQQKTFKIAVNYHSFGHLMIIPFNHQIDNNIELQNDFPVHYSYYQELTSNPKFPDKIPMGNGKKVIGYSANGEASDWMLSVHKILAFSPELGIYFSGENGSNPYYKFYPKIKDCSEIINYNLPFALLMIERAGYFLKLSPLKSIFFSCAALKELTKNSNHFSQNQEVLIENCSDEHIVYQYSLGLQNIGLGSLNTNQTMVVESEFNDAEYVVISFPDASLTKTVSVIAKNIEGKFHQEFNVSNIDPNKFIQISLQIFTKIIDFETKNFNFTISTKSLGKLNDEYVFEFNNATISIEKSNFTPYFKDPIKINKFANIVNHENNLWMVLFIFICIFVAIFIAALFTLKRVRIYLGLSQETEVFNNKIEIIEERGDGIKNDTDVTYLNNHTQRIFRGDF